MNPMNDSKFVYKKERWANLNSDYKALIREFEDKEITRQNIIDAFNDYYIDSSVGFMKAFLLTMVWGFADTGYGTHRTNSYVSTEENRNKIQKALDWIKNDSQDSLKKAFKELKGIKGLGISYLTKVLYFATKAKNESNYALIFDNRVATALIKLTTPREIYDIVNIGPSSKYNDYEKFNRLIHKLANANLFNADQLEMYLFNQDFE